MRTLALFLTFVWTLPSIALAETGAPKKTYLIAVDGLSYESFQLARSQGLFREFAGVGAHVAPFPSMTDLSWSAMVKTPEIFGSAGRIRSVEAVYFDESRKTVEGDVRDVYRRMAAPKLYLNAFKHLFNPYLEALMYFPTKELARVEIESVLNSMTEDNAGDLVTGYIGGIDSTAHTQKDRLYPVLHELDRQLKTLIQKLRAKEKNFEVILISDHGNGASFPEGRAETELQGVQIEDTLKSAGLNLTQQIKNPNDVAIPLMALGTWAPVYLSNMETGRKLISSLEKQIWFDFAVQRRERSSDKIILDVFSSRGSARVTYYVSGKSYSYQPITGNPLDIPHQFQSQKTLEILSRAEVEKITRATNYPDSLIRLAEAVGSPHFDFPDLILTLKDGYYFNSAFGSMTKMYRTHGSLSRKSSLGLVATTARAVPAYMRSQQILTFFGIRPEKMFGELAESENRTPEESLERIQRAAGVPTGHKNFSQKRIFQQMTKVIASSRPFFILDEIKSFLTAFKVSTPSMGPLQMLNVNPAELQAKPLIDPNEIGEITDLVIKTPDINKIRNDPRILQLKSRFGGDSISPAAVGLKDTRALSAKRAAMKIYQLPHMLDQAMIIQEKPLIRESRNLDFSHYWLKYEKTLTASSRHLNANTGRLLSWIPGLKNQAPLTPAKELFSEVLKEKILEDRITPEPLEMIYKEKLKATIVYVPGTYNGIFDREIFSAGLLSLEEDLGLRVLRAPVFSACGSDYNGNLLIKFLKQDQKKFVERKESPPKYILIGYSKGAVDSLHGFSQDSEFIQKNVLGLVAVASPLKGSEVLEKADLPFALVDQLIEEETPKICQEKKTIFSTMNKPAINSFWRKNEQTLIGLTRYFSVSFISTPEDSHLFMKITKVIGQFDEDNDGIVTLSASRFPSRLSAVDLGIVEGDHLAGILSSRFPQKAFMRALATTLAELKIEDEKIHADWRFQSIVDAAPTKIEGKYSFAANPVTHTLNLFSYNRGGHLTSAKEFSFRDPYELNKWLLNQPDPLANYESQTKLPSNQLAFDPFQMIDASKLTDILSAKKVSPSQPPDYREGLDLSFKHKNMLFYRMDHQFFFENRSPVGGDDNAKSGFEAVSDKTGPLLALRSVNNSYRLTTLAYRFKIADFNWMDLSLKVTEGPQGADPVKGRSGKDDSAFQIWFTLRDLRGIQDRSSVSKDTPKVYFFGYYWGEEMPNEKRTAGQIFENYYSNKNVVIANLPESFQLLLNNGNEKKSQMVSYRQNLVADIGRAFPKLDPNQLEVVAITLQMDSNDTGTRSEAFMRTLRFSPPMKDGMNSK